ncbi:MAG: PhzF family phenazine biosynthesis protein [Ilumatobacteraceae bacterium]
MSEVRRFLQVDVFGERPLLGNPVAVVLDADGLDDSEMAAVARWTNLSETTFVLPPTDEGADYRVRIFTPGGELPFAGHPTLGTCHAWLQAAGDRRLGLPGAGVVQQCGLGLVPLRVGASGTLAFAAPEPVMSELSGELLDGIIAALGVDAGEVSAARVIDNGPNWHVLLLSSSDVVRRLRPDMAALAGLAKVGVVGPHPRRRRWPVRPAGVRPERRRAGGPGDGKPQRRRRAVADRGGTRAAPLHGHAGRVHRPRRPHRDRGRADRLRPRPRRHRRHRRRRHDLGRWCHRHRRRRQHHRLTLTPTRPRPGPHPAPFPDLCVTNNVETRRCS